MELASGINGPVSVVWQIRGTAHGAKIQPSQAKNAVECTVANQPDPQRSGVKLGLLKHSGNMDIDHSNIQKQEK